MSPQQGQGEAQGGGMTLRQGALPPMPCIKTGDSCTCGLTRREPTPPLLRAHAPALGPSQPLLRAHAPVLGPSTPALNTSPTRRGPALLPGDDAGQADSCASPRPAPAPPPHLQWASPDIIITLTTELALVATNRFQESFRSCHGLTLDHSCLWTALDHTLATLRLP